MRVNYYILSGFLSRSRSPNPNVSNFSSLEIGKLDAAFFSVPVLDVGAHVFELREDFGEERGLGVDPEHGLAQLVDDVDAAVPELVLVRLDQEWLQRVADLVAHVAAKKGRLFEKRTVPISHFVFFENYELPNYITF